MCALLNVSVCVFVSVCLCLCGVVCMVRAQQDFGVNCGTGRQWRRQRREVAAGWVGGGGACGGDGGDGEVVAGELRGR